MGFSFRELKIEDAQQALDWRNKKRVTKFMNTDLSDDLESQKNWILNSFNERNSYNWIIQYHNKPIGLIRISDFNPIKKTAGWGFYIGSDEHVGLGGFVPPYFYNFCFNLIGIETIYAVVHYDCTPVIKLHLYHGYNFIPQKDIVIEKNGGKILIICMSLQYQTFANSKFSNFIAKFPTDRWKYSPLKILTHNESSI